MNSDINDGLELIILYQYWLISYNKGSTLMLDVNNIIITKMLIIREAVLKVRDYIAPFFLFFFYFPLDFPVNLELV